MKLQSLLWAIVKVLAATLAVPTSLVCYALLRYEGLRHLLLSFASRVLYKNVARKLPRAIVTSGARERLQLVGRASYARAVGISDINLERVVKRECPVAHISVEGLEIQLDGTLLSPAARAGEPLPVVLIRTPYRRENALNLGWTYAERGYHVLVQDTRGRFGSSGEFFPVAHEIEDGKATVTWIKKQPFCKDGKVGCIGISYLGLAAWAAASGDSGVSCLVPCLASSRLFPIFKAPNGGGLSLDLGLRWLYIVLNLQMSNVGMIQFLYRLLISAPQLDRALLHVPLDEADAMVTLSGDHVAFFQDALNNLSGDEPFWSNKDILFDVENERVPPVHIIGGWHDFFLEQQLKDYAAAERRNSRPRLTIGDFAHWDMHKYTHTLHASALELFDRHLKCSGNDDAGDDSDDLPVKVKLMGGGSKRSNGWIRLRRWPPPDVVSTHFYFNCDGMHLAMESTSRIKTRAQYVYDPAKPTPFVGGRSFNPSNSGPKDQGAFEQRDDVIIFTSDILTSAVRVVGTVKAQIVAMCDIAHLDIVVRLCDVSPSGKSINVCDGMMRMEEASGEFVFKFDVANTAYEFAAKHRIRVQVCSGAHPKWLRNYGTGAPIARAVELKPAHVKASSGSYVTLPVMMLPAPTAVPHHRM